MSICPPTWPTSLHHIPFDISCRIFRFQTIKDRRSYCHHYDYDHMIIAIIILWQCLWRRWSWNNFSTGDNACNENHFVTVENCEKKYFSTGESLTKTNFPFEGMVGYYSTFDQVNMPSNPHFDIILHDQSSSTEDKRILNSKSKHLKGNVLVSLSQPFLIKNGKKEIRPHSGPTCTEGLNIHKSPKNS